MFVSENFILQRIWKRSVVWRASVDCSSYHTYGTISDHPSAPRKQTKIWPSITSSHSPTYTKGSPAKPRMHLVRVWFHRLLRPRTIHSKTCKHSGTGLAHTPARQYWRMEKSLLILSKARDASSEGHPDLESVRKQYRAAGRRLIRHWRTAGDALARLGGLRRHARVATLCATQSDWRKGTWVALLVGSQHQPICNTIKIPMEYQD